MPEVRDAGTAKIAATRFSRVGTRRVRILIADDHALFRQALGALLESEPDIEIVGEVASGLEAVSTALHLRPDLVLMDLVMPDLNGIEATRQIRRELPDCQVLILSAYLDDDRVLQAIRAGALGFVLKDLRLADLRIAIQTTLRGASSFSTRITDRMSADEIIKRARQPHERDSYDLLSPREREVLQLIAEGSSNQGIAEALVMSVKTVEAHKAHTMTKLNARTRTELIRYGIGHGLVSMATPTLDAPAREA